VVCFGFSGDRKRAVAQQLPQSKDCGLRPFSVLNYIFTISENMVKMFLFQVNSDKKIFIKK